MPLGRERKEHTCSRDPAHANSQNGRKFPNVRVSTRYGGWYFPSGYFFIHTVASDGGALTRLDDTLNPAGPQNRPVE